MNLRENIQLAIGLALILFGALFELVEPSGESSIFIFGGSFFIVGGSFKALTGKPEHLFQRRRVIASASTQGLFLLISVAIAVSISKAFLELAAFACIALLILGFALTSRENARPQVTPAQTLPPLARLTAMEWIEAGKLLGLSLIGISYVLLIGPERWAISKSTALLAFEVPLGLGLIAAIYIAIAKRSPPFHGKKPRSVDPDAPRATRAYIGLAVLLGLPSDLALLALLVTFFASAFPGLFAGTAVAAAVSAIVIARWERSNNTVLLCDPVVEGIAKEHYVISPNKRGKHKTQ